MTDPTSPVAFDASAEALRVVQRYASMLHAMNDIEGQEETAVSARDRYAQGLQQLVSAGQFKPVAQALSQMDDLAIRARLDIIDDAFRAALLRRAVGTDGVERHTLLMAIPVSGMADDLQQQPLHLWKEVREKFSRVFIKDETVDPRSVDRSETRPRPSVDLPEEIGGKAHGLEAQFYPLEGSYHPSVCATLGPDALYALTTELMHNTPGPITRQIKQQQYAMDHTPRKGLALCSPEVLSHVWTQTMHLAVLTVPTQLLRPEHLGLIIAPVAEALRQQWEVDQANTSLVVAPLQDYRQALLESARAMVGSRVEVERGRLGHAHGEDLTTAPARWVSVVPQANGAIELTLAIGRHTVEPFHLGPEWRQVLGPIGVARLQQQFDDPQDGTVAAPQNLAELLAQRLREAMGGEAVALPLRGASDGSPEDDDFAPAVPKKKPTLH